MCSIVVLRCCIHLAPIPTCVSHIGYRNPRTSGIPRALQSHIRTAQDHLFDVIHALLHDPFGGFLPIVKTELNESLADDVKAAKLMEHGDAERLVAPGEVQEMSARRQRGVPFGGTERRVECVVDGVLQCQIYIIKCTDIPCLREVVPDVRPCVSFL